jgi:hypothetical protein
MPRACRQFSEPGLEESFILLASHRTLKFS